MIFSQQEPELTQTIAPPRNVESANFQNLTKEAQNQVVTNLSRLILFKALNGEPIDRLKLTKEASNNNAQNDYDAHENRSSDRVLSAALHIANQRLKNVFGMEIKRIPAYMEPSLPQKYKDRLYVVNEVQDDDSGSHSKALHSVHVDSSIEKGLLMVILALIYCNGQTSDDHKKNKGAASSIRWITSTALYSLLHKVDENIPEEPPKSHKKSLNSRLSQSLDMSMTMMTQGDDREESRTGVGWTPNVDVVLEKLVHQDYLMRKKTDGVTTTSQARSGTVTDDDSSIVYAMGPRSAIEIGLKQIIYFCAEVLDEQPDPTMLAEIEHLNAREEEEEVVAP